jgi:hypothetical protein
MQLHLFYFVVWNLFYLIWFRKLYLKKVLENKQIKKRKKKKKEKQLTFYLFGLETARPVLPRPRLGRVGGLLPLFFPRAWAGPADGASPLPSSSH